MFYLFNPNFIKALREYEENEENNWIKENYYSELVDKN